jgi:hypothetical protein
MGVRQSRGSGKAVLYTKAVQRWITAGIAAGRSEKVIVS